MRRETDCHLSPLVVKFLSKAIISSLLAILFTNLVAYAQKPPVHEGGNVAAPKKVRQVKPIDPPKVAPEPPLQPVEQAPAATPAPEPTPAPAPAYSGSLSDWLLKLRMCESGGNYAINTGNGFYGAYQFTVSTWDSLNTGYARADLAPPAVQDQAIIANTNRSSGGLATQNPGCYSKEGLSAFPPA